MVTGPESVPDPPERPDPLFESWPTSDPVFRVHHQQVRPGAFNPGPRPTGRFSFFGMPPVPVLYGGATPEVAVAETLFRDIPLRGGRLTADAYLPRMLSVLRPARDLQLAQLHSGGLRRLGLTAREITDTEAVHYPRTVRWAEAIHRNTEADGLVWISRQWNNAKAAVLFGDRVTEQELTVEVAGRRGFSDPADVEWLAALGQSVRIAVMPDA